MICCVEDDNVVREMMIYTLKTTGFSAVGYPDGESFFASLANDLPELILLDIMLPGENGLTILQKLRQRPDTAGIPVIMTTAKGSEYDKVIGLDYGADDYLVKPFGMMEMISRVKAVLRRISGPAASPSDTDIKPIIYGSLTINPDEHTVFVGTERVLLTLKEFDLLYLMLSNPGRVFTRDFLLARIWNTSYEGETRTVDVHIRTLRRKLGICENYIETIRGVGYRLNTDINS